jgi:hypothetical protein
MTGQAEMSFQEGLKNIFQTILEIKDLRVLESRFTTKITKLHEVETEPDGGKNRNLRRFRSPTKKV